MLYVILDYAMPVLPPVWIAGPGFVAKITSIDIVKISLIVPALFDELVLEYAADDYGITAGTIIKMVGIDRSLPAALGEHVDIFVLSILAKEDPVFHLPVPFRDIAIESFAAKFRQPRFQRVDVAIVVV